MRLIDADALIKELKYLECSCSSGGHLDDYYIADGVYLAINYVEEAPTVEDVVQVVRCKDCEYGEDTGEDTGNDYLCRFNGSDWNGGEHFCSYGKRRGEGE